MTPLGRFSDPVSLSYLGLFFTMIVWSLVPVFLKKLLAVLTPTELSFSRFLLSGLVLLAWVIPKRRDELLRMIRQDLKLLLLCTVFGPLTAMVFLNFALLHVTVGTVAVFAAIEPVCTYLLAVMIGQEGWRGKRMLSILLALSGMILVILSRRTWGIAYWISLVLATLTPVVWAANNIITKELVRRHSPIVMVAASFVLSSLFLIPTLSKAYMQSIAHMGLLLWLFLVYCIVSTIVGFSIWYWSLRHLAPSTVAVSMYIIPVCSVAAGMVFLQEPMSWLKGSGILMVLSGLYLVNVRFR